jgi:hypothetical protein
LAVKWLRNNERAVSDMGDDLVQLLLINVSFDGKVRFKTSFLFVEFCLGLSGNALLLLPMT